MPNMDLTLITALGGAVGGLTTAVVFMFKFILKQFDEVKAEVKECREDREKLWNRISEITTQIERS